MLDIIIGTLLRIFPAH